MIGVAVTGYLDLFIQENAKNEGRKKSSMNKRNKATTRNAEWRSYERYQQ
jgi:hypothetical protein